MILTSHDLIHTFTQAQQNEISSNNKINIGVDLCTKIGTPQSVQKLEERLFGFRDSKGLFM